MSIKISSILYAKTLPVFAKKKIDIFGKTRKPSCDIFGKTRNVIFLEKYVSPPDSLQSRRLNECAKIYLITTVKWE